MKRKIQIILIAVFFIIITIPSCTDSPVDPPPVKTLEDAVNEIASKYIKVGGIVGIISKEKEKLIIPYGSKSTNTTDPPDANTVFDIGSITKTFTAILVADRYLKGTIQGDTVQNYLPKNKVVLPTLENKQISFLQLLTHTSGLPRTPHEEGSTYPKPTGYDIENPYAAYTTAHIYDYLTNYCTLKFVPGTFWEYSNIGFGLVGHILGLVDGTSYETVLTRDIFNKLGMNNSSLFLTTSQMTNKALGHDTNKKTVPFCTANDIFQGAGMIKSSMNDMIKYLEANLGLTGTTLRNAMDLTYQPVMRQGSLGDQGLAWWILNLDDGQKIIYSAGNTNGHSSYIAFNREKSTGVVILFNSSNHDGVNITMGHEVMKAILKY